MAAADWDGYLIAPNATGDGVTRQILEQIMKATHRPFA